jgi:hypothetical protein
MRSLLIVAFLLLFAPAAFAQDSGEIPTLTTDDIRPPTVQAVAGPELDAMWEKVYDGMQRDAKLTKADVEQVRARIESGQEIGIRLHVTLDGGSKVTGIFVDQGTGIVSLDRQMRDLFAPLQAGLSLGPDFAGFHRIDVDAAVTKTRMRLGGSTIAPSPERAEAIERQIQQARAQFERSVPNGSSIGQNLAVTRDGASIAVSLSFDLGLVAASVPPAR